MHRRCDRIPGVAPLALVRATRSANAAGGPFFARHPDHRRCDRIPGVAPFALVRATRSANATGGPFFARHPDHRRCDRIPGVAPFALVRATRPANATGTTSFSSHPDPRSPDEARTRRLREHHRFRRHRPGVRCARPGYARVVRPDNDVYPIRHPSSPARISASGRSRPMNTRVDSRGSSAIQVRPRSVDMSMWTPCNTMRLPIPSTLSTPL